LSTLGSVHVLESTITIPEWGAWQVDCSLEGGTPPTGDLVLKTGSAVFKGRTLRSGFDGPDRPRVVIVGALGWQGSITAPLSFQSDAGVRLSTVLSAIARGAGQEIVQPTDVTIGNYYELVASRPGEIVRWADALDDLVRSGYVQPWRVDPDGVTLFGSRTPKEVAARATVLKQNAGVGITKYGIDDPIDFLPGNTIGGVKIARVVLREKSSKFEADVSTTEPAAPPSIRDQVRRMVRSEMENHVRTYIVAAVGSDGRVDLVPPPDSPHIPEMKHVEPWTLGGTKYEATPGEEMTVLFRDDRKTRPIVIGTKLGEGPFAGIARLGDTVVVMLPPATFSGTIAGSPASGMVVWAPGQTTGTITTASAKTKAGP
jgi:hypothetical protein